VDQFSKKIETGWSLARIETVTPQQMMDKAKERGVIVDSRISFWKKNITIKNTINKRKIENPKKYFKFIKVKQNIQSS